MEVEDLAELALAAGDEDPRKALTAAAALRHESDRLEATVVRRARVTGMSWTEIAGALGVTRQAVHKKYGRA